MQRLLCTPENDVLEQQLQRAFRMPDDNSIQTFSQASYYAGCGNPGVIRAVFYLPVFYAAE